MSEISTLAELKAQLKDLDQRITLLENQTKNDVFPKKNEGFDDWMQRLKEETRTPPLSRFEEIYKIASESETHDEYVKRINKFYYPQEATA